MKKAIILLLCAALTLGLAACGEAAVEGAKHLLGADHAFFRVLQFLIHSGFASFRNGRSVFLPLFRAGSAPLSRKMGTQKHRLRTTIT